MGVRVPGESGESGVSGGIRSGLRIASLATALAGGFADRAQAQTPYEFEDSYSPRDVDIQKMNEPGSIKLNFLRGAGSDWTIQEMDARVARHGNTVFLDILSSPTEVRSRVGELLYYDHGNGECDVLEINVYNDQRERVSEMMWNGVDKWSVFIGSPEISVRIFPTMDGKVGINTDHNAFYFPINPASRDWGTDFDNLAGGPTIYSNGGTDRVLSTLVCDDRGVSYGDGIRLFVRTRCRNPSDDGPRVTMAPPEEGANTIHLQSFDGGATYVPEAQQQPVGTPDTAIDNLWAANGVSGFDGLQLIYGSYPRPVPEEGNFNGFQALQIQGDGRTVTNDPVVIRDFTTVPGNLFVPGNADANNNGVVDVGEVGCSAENPVDVNGFAPCEENDLGFVQAFRRAVDGSVFLADAGVTFGIEQSGEGSDTLHVGGIPEDGTARVRWSHALAATGTATPSPTIELEQPPEGYGYNVVLHVYSTTGLDGQSHPIRVINANDIINGAVSEVREPNAEGIALEFEGGTIAAFALEATDVELLISLVPRAAPVPDAGAVDAAESPDGPADGGTDGPADANRDDAAVADARILDAGVVEDAAVSEDLAPPTDLGRLEDSGAQEDGPAHRDDAAIVDARMLDAALADLAVADPDAGAVEDAESPDDPADSGDTPDMPEDSAVPDLPTEPECHAEVEVCDGIDNDCDEAVDENLTQERSNACGSWNARCIGGRFVDPEGITIPVPEICNDIDDDCDEAVDEGAEGGLMILAMLRDPCTQEELPQLCISGQPEPEDMPVECDAVDGSVADGGEVADAMQVADGGVADSLVMGDRAEIPDAGMADAYIANDSSAAGGTGGSGGMDNNTGGLDTTGGTDTVGGEGGHGSTDDTLTAPKKSGGSCTVARADSTSSRSLVDILTPLVATLGFIRRRSKR